MKRKVYIALMILCAAVFVFSAVYLLLVLNEYLEADRQYSEMQNDYVSDPTTKPDAKPDTGSNTDEEPPKPAVPIDVDFQRLLQKNSDVVGWLYCEDSVINYPVVQAADNQEYLHKGLNGEYLRSGTLYVDYRNGEPMTDKNLILYGHSMKNGSMFGMLLHYKKQSYYDAHPVMYYLTPEQNYRVELFAGRVVKTDALVYRVTPDEDTFWEYLQTMQEKSTFQSDVTITKQDKFITLSTCSYEFDDARYVVLGKLIPIEE